ncbi:DUF1304 domain-containing protein [Sinomonas sp. P10A9]|uniref:DUF1304 domain-containing protein n=1 Tax=Sinomonas puerhi TaxID=3238584 RepID=A0AB39L7K4_9MICC
MLIASAVLAAMAGALHVYIFVLESVRWTHPSTMRTFGVRSRDEAETTRLLAFNQGFYNLFLAVGALVGAGLVLWVPAFHQAARALLVMTCGSMFAAAIVLILSDRTKARAATVQGVLPLLSLVSLALAGRG